MKQKLLRATLLLSSILLCLYSSYAQTHYIKSNSVPGVEIREGGGVNSICPVTVSHFSAANSTDQFFFSPLTCLADYLKFEILNPTTGAVKVTLTTTYGAAVNQWVLAPNNSTGVMLIPWSMTYNWKFETSTLPFSMKADTVQLDAGLGANILPGTNDIAVPSGTGFRVKSGQTITLGTLVPSIAGSAELFFTSNNTTGSQNIVLEAYNTTTNAVLGESALRLIVNTRCNFGIMSAVQESLGSQFYNVTMTSNRTTKPYYYEILNNIGNIVKRGNTSAANLSSVENIDVGNIASGIYTIKMYSTSLQGCGEPTKQFSHVNATDVCTLNASASKVGSSYTITLPVIAGISAYDYVFKTSTDSVISQGTTNSTTLSLSFANRADGEYFVFLKPNNSVKVCSQNLKLIWSTTQSNNSRGYLKRYNNAADYFEIAGAGDYTGTKDAGTGWIIKDNKTSLVWKTYIKSLSNVSGAKAILTLREDSSSASRHISIAIENDRIKVIQRLNKNGNNTVTTEITGKTAPRWVQIKRVGNTAILEESNSAADSDIQTFTTIATVNDIFSTWKPIYYKGLYVNSGSSTSLASAEFHRFLGGAYTGTSATVDDTPLSPPTIASSNLNPTANASVTLSASACKSGFLIQYYKNGLPIYQGGNYTAIVTYGDSYKAKCEKGADKSAFSNTIAFNAPVGDQICGIANNLKLGVKTVGTTTYDIFARIFNGKLWVTQSLGTTPESFLVRGVNLLNATFVKSWTGSDYSCFEGQSTGFGGLVEPTGFTTPAGYTLTTTADGAKIYTLGTVAGDGSGGTGTTDFVNVVKSVPVELTNGKYSPQLFKLSTNNAIPRSIDPVLGKPYPNWAVAWQAEGGNFSRNNTTTVDVGMAFMYDRNPVSYAGYGERCLDFIYETNPDTGQPWASDIDPSCNKTWQTFTSRIPFHERASSLYGVASDGDRTAWITNSTSWVFDKGVEGVSSRGYGWGDRVNGKVNTGLINCDIEIGLEQGFEYYPKHLAFLLGMGSASQGYVFSQYSAAINEVGANLSFYPDNSGVFPTVRKKIDGTNYLDGNGATVTNNIPLSPDWNPTSKITISDKGITDKGVIDYPNVLPCIEISSTSDMTYRHGESYARKNGWAYNNGTLSYAASNPIDNTTVDKFGMDRNTNHIIADIICYGDVNKWWSVNKLNGRKVILQSKITCDRANMGVFHEAGFTNQSLRFKHYDREYGFDIGGFTALTGCEWQIWDRNTQENLDGYHGALGVVNLMNQKKSFGSSSVSFADLKPRLNFLLWNSEVSYDNGLNYFKDKATEYVLSENKLPQRQAISTDGYWVIFAARPEGIEPTTAKFRVTYNGTVYYHSIGANDWETVDYNQRNASLSNLPVGKKDYYFTIIKLGSQTSEGTSVTAPVINSNPTNPTAGTAVTFSTSSACAGTIKWWSGDAQMSSGLSYTVTNPLENDSYFATCTVGTTVSLSSNLISIAANIYPPTGSITITEPNKPQYYFSNGHAPSYYDNNINMPAIHQSGTRNVTNYSGKILSGITMQSNYSPTNDLVWLQNDKIKVGINLLRGGQIAWLSTLNSTTNLVYNGYDGGFQISIDAYQRQDGYTQNGKFSRKNYSETLQYNGVTNNSDNPLTSYNTTMGGDFNNNSQSLIAYYRITNGYVVKYRPIFYTLDAEFSQVTIEVKYTLQPGASSVRCEYTYHSFRTDNQFTGGGFDGAAAPSCFIVNTLNRYQVYAGNAPFTNAAIEDGVLPIENYAQPLIARNATERFACVYNPQTLKTVGIYIPNSNPSEYVRLKQLEVYAGNPAGTEFTGGFTHFDFFQDFANPIPDRSNYTKTILGYMIATDNPADARAEAYRLKTLLGN